MKELFYHDYSKGSLYTSAEFYSRTSHDGLTYHPLKDPAMLFRLHQLFIEKAIARNQAKIDQMHQRTHPITANKIKSLIPLLFF